MSIPFISNEVAQNKKQVVTEKNYQQSGASQRDAASREAEMIGCKHDLDRLPSIRFGGLETNGIRTSKGVIDTPAHFLLLLWALQLASGIHADGP